MSINCLPNINCAPFSDPDVDETALVGYMRQQALAEKLRELKPSDWECEDKHLKRFLVGNSHHVEGAMDTWREWVAWRHSVGAESINPDMDFSEEASAGLATWQGVDKQGRPIAIITGRNLRARNRTGNFRSFQKFLIKTVEDGMRKADELGVDEICIVYDRRGLEYDNIDPVLYQMCRKTTESLKQWYGRRIGAFYILHMAWWEWLLFAAVIKPILAMTAKGAALQVIDTAEELREFIEEDNIHLLPWPVAQTQDQSVDQQIVGATEDEGGIGKVSI